ncbi:hypothetical protein GE09DRAFT_1132129 [Coniochaeta sp. 2T2.1]|nr:hypothetical protein GE09DRAFT_1132129 [Coniochaeta sp. 2T2.1]
MSDNKMPTSSESGQAREQEQKLEAQAAAANSDAAPGGHDGDGAITTTAGAQQLAPFNQTKLGIVTVTVGLAVLVVFLANMVYLFGSSFGQPHRNHVFKIAAVNYDVDDSLVWSALTQAYVVLHSDSFASFVFLPRSDYPDPDDLVHAVREQGYWGAVYINQGASSRLSSAIDGQSQTYNASQALTYVWNEIRYPATSASVIRSGILQLQAAATKTFQAGATARLLRAANSTTATNFQTALAAYLTPFTASEININPAPQAEKAFYNTVVMAMSIIQQNVFLIAFTTVSRQLGLFSRQRRFKTSATWALLVGLAYTLLGSLVTTGYIWAFREAWAVNASQFAITWMVLWLVQHTYYQLLDGTLALVPIQFFSFLLVTFVFVNISATVFPLESMPGFYRWGHALPAYQSFQVLLNVWSRGSHKLYEALPVLFTWWVVSASYAAVGTMKKVKDGRKGGGTGVAAPAGI